MDEQKIILSYVSQYKEKYFIDESLGKLPDAVRNEILMSLIMITEEAGGVTELGFWPDGSVYVDSYCEEGDLGYDAVAGGLLVREMEREHREVLEQLELWYRTQKLRQTF